MSVLLDGTTRVCIVGITGGRARNDLARNTEYGTNVVCGVAPGRGGQEVDGVPVFGTAAEAMDAVGFDAASIYVPPAAYCEAVGAVLETRPAWVHVVTEGVPLHDNVRIRARARQLGVRLIGPNTNGLITPGEAKIGFIAHAPWVVTPGRVGVLSRSGGYAHDICFVIGEAGHGVSTAIAIGGDAVVGQSFAELIRLFEDDPATDAVVIYGEAGPPLEMEVASDRRNGITRKPLLAMVSGDYLDGFAAGRTLGHAGAFLAGPEYGAPAKRDAIRDAGGRVVERLADLPAALAEVLPRTGKTLA